MNSKRRLLDRQRYWALQLEGADLDARGYLSTVDANLYQPLSRPARKAFESGSGSEMRDTTRRRAKMKALHSSAALAVNVFDYWTGRDLAYLVASLGLEPAAESFAFEAQFPTGLDGNPPNLDIAMLYANGMVVGIESKFSEWLAPKSPRKDQFKAKYFPDDTELWTAKGLPAAQRLADALRNGEVRFRYLDAAQLLKHTLGLATANRSSFALYYLFYDCPGHESLTHREEIDYFKSLIGNDFAFRWGTYQDTFRRLAVSAEREHGPYVGYLRQRYFDGVA